jgi:glutathione peroxidase
MTAMKTLSVLILVILSVQVLAQKKTLYDFTANTIDGKAFSFAELIGKKVLIVNIATECSLAPQIGKLQELYEEYGGDDFEIVAFPCNDFGRQEPGPNTEIKEKCNIEYKINFKQMEKVKIKGDSIHPVYRWLTSSGENGVLDAKVTWNYQKFMIDENGEVVDALAPIISPKCNRIVEWLME